ncbi:MAG: hypothetical protein Q8Q08_00550 [Candidatus Omnitrophota bacterium]|nr:hypothetical protein [Candidatus Omnitrophota bacterium]MDZ4241903.1 hypothetical protein [Candidatus Omnitrophota bacterium]
MKKHRTKGSLQTVILFVLIAPVIGYLIWFSVIRNQQFEEKAQQCRQDCTVNGYLESDFKWSAFTRSECVCAGQL